VNADVSHTPVVQYHDLFYGHWFHGLAAASRSHHVKMGMSQTIQVMQLQAVIVL
jgi:hypothetical protein